MGKIIHEQLSGAIIGIAMEVLNELNPGLDEILSERAMAIELRSACGAKANNAATLKQQMKLDRRLRG